MSTSASVEDPHQDSELWTLRGLIADHRAAALGVAAVCAVMVAMIMVAVLGAKAGAVTDQTTCTEWGSANQNRQNAYATLYIREHGPAPGWAPSPVGVINAINAGCAQAYGDDVSDTATVVQAISRSF